MFSLKTQFFIGLVCLINVSVIQSSDVLIKYLCPEIRPTNCANVSGPTCGYFSQSTQCLNAPCAQKYNNPCEACGDQKVESISCGECIVDTPSTKATIKLIKNKFKLPLCLDIKIPNVPKELIN